MLCALDLLGAHKAFSKLCQAHIISFTPCYQQEKTWTSKLCKLWDTHVERKNTRGRKSFVFAEHKHTKVSTKQWLWNEFQAKLFMFLFLPVFFRLFFYILKTADLLVPVIDNAMILPANWKMGYVLVKNVVDVCVNFFAFYEHHVKPSERACERMCEKARIWWQCERQWLYMNI